MGDDRVTTIPLLPAVDMQDALAFWTALGFEVGMTQRAPNAYAVIRRGAIVLHLFGLKGLAPEQNFTSCLVIVPEVEALHTEFSAQLKAALGRTPARGFPRLSRMKPGQTRFTVTDVSGNSVIFVRRGPEDDEAADAYKRDGQTPLERATSLAARLRDFKGDDDAAAKVLDTALARHGETASPEDLAVALDARDELTRAGAGPSGRSTP